MSDKAMTMHADATALQAALGDRYRLLRKLGYGGTSVVYQATDTKHKRNVALKSLNPELAHGMTLNRFEREIAFVARLTHPNILALLDSGVAAGVPYFVMPYVAGVSLAGRLAQAGRLPVHEAVRLVCEVADALEYAHAAGVLHRDIKPENILLIAHHAVVADFGAGWLINEAARRAGPETQVGIVVGTVDYISPEQASGMRTLDGRSDEYSLALVLYEALAGKLPFSGKNAQAMLAQRFSVVPRPLRELRADVPEAIEHAVARALSQDPEKRFPRIADFANALIGAQGTGTPPAGIDAITDERSGSFTRSSSSSKRVTQSIAVLPFVTIGQGTDEQHLAFGLAGEISTALGQLRSLHVIAQPSWSPIDSEVDDIRAIGERLGARAVLHGSIQRADKTFRIIARLVSTVDGTQLWAQQFQHEDSTLFAVQEDIARGVVEALEVQLLGQTGRAIAAVPTTNAAAYELYLRARYAWSKRTEEQLERSVRLFEQSIALDREFAEAHAGLADAYFSLCVYGTRAPKEVMPAARRAVEDALTMDPTSAAAHATSGAIAALYDWNWAKAEEEFQRAIVLDPMYSTAHHWYAVNHLAPLGRHAEAVAEVRRAIELEPLSPVLAASHGIVLFAARRYGESVREYEHTLELEPNFGLAHYFMGQAHVQLGAYARAIHSFERAIDLSGRSPELISALGHACGVSGDTERAMTLLRELEGNAQSRYVSPYALAQVHMGLGNHAEALAQLQRAVDARASELTWIGVRAVWDGLRSTPSFIAISEAIKLPIAG